MATSLTSVGLFFATAAEVLSSLGHLHDQEARTWRTPDGKFKSKLRRPLCLHLSVRVDEDKDGLFARFSDISEPPETLKSLKAYGHVQISPVWLLQLQNIKKVNFGLSILTQRDIEELPLYRLPINNGYGRIFRVLEIDCTSRLELSFGERRGWVVVLKIQCSSGSSLHISLLENLIWLKEVRLSGFYHDDLKQDLERQLSSHPNEPVLKTEEPRSS